MAQAKLQGERRRLCLTADRGSPVGARGRWLPAIVGGLMLGAGSAIAMVTYASLPLGEATPVATVGLGVIVGLAAGGFGRRQLHRAAPTRGVAGG